MPIRVLLVDDQRILIDGLRALLSVRSAEFEVVGQVSESKEALQATQKLKPDQILLDIDMPEKSGLDVLRDLQTHASEDWKPKVIMLSLHADKSHIAKAFHYGARGYLVKGEGNLHGQYRQRYLWARGYLVKGEVGERDVLEALRTVQQGNLYCCPQSKLVYDALKYEQPITNTDLTPRQLDIAKLVATGKTSKEIADELSLSPRTVENHRNDILKKLHLRNATELVVYAKEQGW